MTSSSSRWLAGENRRLQCGLRATVPLYRPLPYQQLSYITNSLIPPIPLYRPSPYIALPLCRPSPYIAHALISPLYSAAVAYTPASPLDNILSAVMLSRWLLSRQWDTRGRRRDLVLTPGCIDQATDCFMGEALWARFWADCCRYVWWTLLSSSSRPEFERYATSWWNIFVGLNASGDKDVTEGYAWKTDLSAGCCRESW